MAGLKVRNLDDAIASALKARRSERRLARGGGIAPRLMLTEVAGALHRKVAAGKLREMLASDALEELLRTVGSGRNPIGSG